MLQKVNIPGYLFAIIPSLNFPSLNVQIFPFPPIHAPERTRCFLVVMDAEAAMVEHEHEEGPVSEPCVGMEFESEEAAKQFYDEYARRAGFTMRIDQCRRSEVDKRILSRRFSCNKQGFYVKARHQLGPIRKARSSTREGCKAMLLVKVNKSGKWVVTRFVKEHTHPLVALILPCKTSMDSKDRRIEELTMELERQDQLCELYRGQLISFLQNVEEQTDQISMKIEFVVNNVREFENQVQEHS